MVLMLCFQVKHAAGTIRSGYSKMTQIIEAGRKLL
jgi:hypothetical protein